MSASTPLGLHGMGVAFNIYHRSYLTRNWNGAWFNSEGRVYLAFASRHIFNQHSAAQVSTELVFN
ncbi:uncharacterized protein LY89DRAFT_472917 [Mollisia scopiformis]|uniref:Uncharacterized protein n=1 Tax=Mollisia scopiformis TaxID=149040 RepID=A0A194XIV3_MOLSC|nr:uncharacterized protein LY89DRAFT_472917 [Mollisia scopiformis]KUJ20165.1 hypothetical protein LY89DRAFT_472917 [Mollisia scopiformis]